MKRVVLAGALVILFAAMASPALPRQLRVLTYNIHHGEGMDGQFDLARLAEVMLRTEPDLIALQEVDRRTARAGGVDQLAELERLTGMYGAFGKAMDFQGGAYGVAVLSRFPVLQVQNRALPGSPDREPRTGLTVDVALEGAGPRLHFTSTHLDQGRDLTSRLEQAGYLNVVLAGDDGTPGVLAGDMNSQADTEVMKLLTERWTDMFVAPAPPAPTDRPMRRVDYVLVRPAPMWRTVDSQIIDDRVASDHRPVLVVLEWTGADGRINASRGR
jgi:endonuclease/exonuclease/phosphatase family metal-dependent hydrolase